MIPCVVIFVFCGIISIAPVCVTNFANRCSIDMCIYCKTLSLLCLWRPPRYVLICLYYTAITREWPKSDLCAITFVCVTGEQMQHSRLRTPGGVGQFGWGNTSANLKTRSRLWISFNCLLGWREIYINITPGDRKRWMGNTNANFLKPWQGKDVTNISFLKMPGWTDT